MTDTVTKTGEPSAAPSQTTFYLSTTNVAPYKYALRFNQQRSVGTLLADGATSSGTTNLTFPLAGFTPGNYYVVACADYGNLVAESNESNNCRASLGTVRVEGPDLVVTSLTEPPSMVYLGEVFSVTDTVKNIGDSTAATSNSVYYLSTTNTPPFKYTLRFDTPVPGRRVIPSLDASAEHQGPISLFAPKGIAEGTFYFVACADYGGGVRELNEGNNCRVQTGSITLRAPDLVASAVTISPAVVEQTGTVTLGETISNLNTTASPVSKTSYFLSTDAVRGGGDDRSLRNCADGSIATWRDVPSLTNGSPNTGTSVITGLCTEDARSPTGATPAIAGTYYVIACADGASSVFETVETNNCAVSSSTLQILSDCGNGVPETGETCDDGNNNNGDGCSATCQIQTLSSLEVTPDGITIAKGLTQQYTATATYSDGWTNNVTSSSAWSTGNSSIASITSGGHLSALDQGSTTVSATFGAVSDSTNVTVGAPVQVGVALTPQLPSIAKGTSQQYEAVALYSDFTTIVVTSAATWASSNLAVATVNSSGLATGITVGTTTISATYGGFSDSTTMSVTAATISSIAVTPATHTMNRGTTRQYTAIATFSDNTTQDITTNAVWSSTAPTVATVSAGALVSATAAGTTTIQATLSGKTGTANVTVYDANIQSITVTPANATVPVGFSQQYTAVGSFKQGSTTFTQDITSSVAWTTTSSAVTISSTGLAGVVSAANGVQIKATFGSGAVAKTGFAILNATSVTLVSIAVTPSPLTLAIGGTQQFTATGTFADGTTLDITTQVSWRSSNYRVASVNSIGRGRGTQAGTATISATKNTITGSSNVTVN